MKTAPVAAGRTARVPQNAAATSERLVAVAQALLVTFLWSTSWVLIKLGLDDLSLPPLGFAGLRYSLAALVLLPLAMPALRRSRPWRGDRLLVGRVVLLGLLLYAVAQGAQFAALVHLPAVAVGLALSTTPVVIAVLGRLRGEPALPLQLLGIAALVVGAALYFSPRDLGATALLGLGIAAGGVAANALAAVLGRDLARDRLANVGGVVALTAISMAIGSAVLLGVGLIVEGVPRLTPDAWLIIGWLALVNTAFAFTLWNHTLRTLTAVESGVMNNLMLVQIAALAWIFLGEALAPVEIVGLAIAVGGILVVQVAPLRTSSRRPSNTGRRVLLIGMMGSGKTTIGRLLAERTGWPYHDNDELLEQLYEATPREILGRHGEADLREMESRALALGLAAPPPCIVGVAAGTILDEDDRQRLRTGGVVVWLRGSAETLARRAAGSKHRAWLEGGGETWMRTTLQERGPLYTSVADITVDVDDRTPAEIVDEIVALLQLPRRFTNRRGRSSKPSAR